MLAQLKFTCVGCNGEIGYNEAQKHHDSCCPDKTSKNMILTKTSNISKLKRLKPEEMNKLKNKGNEVIYISGN